MTQGLLAVIVTLLLPPLLLRLLLAGERQARTRQWMALAEEVEEDARRGYKTAQVLVAPDGDEATLAGITHGGTYTVEARASCSSPGCSTPSPGCTCGFYAFKRREDAIELLRQTLAYNGLRHKALLTVDLDGSVLQYERGYRAERQRVLGIQFERECAICPSSAARRATCLAASRQFRVRPFPQPLGGTSSGLSGWPVRPVCERHVPSGAMVLTPADVAGLLGTEVCWLSAA
jgi:hypothetical protein